MRFLRFVYISSLSSIGLLILFIVLSAFTGKVKHPERLITGTWKEVAWKYDKLDKSDTTIEIPAVLNDELKESISQGLHFHQSETWIFDENANLKLEKKNKETVELNWRMKGRGHILKLHYGNQNKEFYQIRKITNDEMILHFENDTHARGIVQIVLRKIK